MPSPPNVKAFPDGYQAITPSLRIRNSAAAIDWYKRVLGAGERMRMAAPDGKVMHPELEIGGSCLMLSDEFPEWNALAPARDGGAGVTIHLYVPDVDAVYAKAIAAGARAIMPPTNQFYGDRAARLVDPFGHDWSLATHVEDVSPEEMNRRAAKLFGG